MGPLAPARWWLAAFALPRQLRHGLAGGVPLRDLSLLANIKRSKAAELGALGLPDRAFRNLPLTRYHGPDKLGPLGRVLGGLRMTNWKADLDALVEETMAFAKKHRVDPPMPHTIVGPSRLPPVNLNNSERDEIQQRVSNFRAHQERFAREREEFAASLLKRMLQRS
jgi:hypothetical protein